MIDRRPALIVRCLGVSDVVACVNAAREHGMPLSIKGGGHNIAGLAVCDGGLMLDMSLMRGVWVDPAAARGARSGRLPARRRGRGDAAPRPCRGARVRLRTGCAGLTLGGGFGYLTRRFGWTSDNLASIDLVTADGQRDPRIRAGEQRPLLGAARRRRQLRCRHELRVQASPGRSGHRRRRDCVAWRRGRQRPRDVSIAGGAGARAS